MSDFNSKEFGNKLRELRKSKGLSQDNLANKLNISRTTIGRFESGEMIPNAQIIKELCEILGVYSTELFEMDYKIKNKDDIKLIVYICISMLIIIEQENLVKVNTN